MKQNEYQGAEMLIFTDDGAEKRTRRHSRKSLSTSWVAKPRPLTMTVDFLIMHRLIIFLSVVALPFASLPAFHTASIAHKTLTQTPTSPSLPFSIHNQHHPTDTPKSTPTTHQPTKHLRTHNHTQPTHFNPSTPKWTASTAPTWAGSQAPLPLPVTPAPMEARVVLHRVLLRISILVPTGYVVRGIFVGCVRGRGGRGGKGEGREGREGERMVGGGRGRERDGVS